MHFGAAIALLHEAVKHRKELAEVAYETIKFLLRVERGVVHHKTDADTYATYAENALADYTGKTPMPNRGHEPRAPKPITPETTGVQTGSAG